ncbi:arginase family protein [Halodesulfovibrio aestuarii]
MKGRNVVGCDVVELAPQEGDHASDFAAAQLTYSMLGIIQRSAK